MGYLDDAFMTEIVDVGNVTSRTKNEEGKPIRLKRDESGIVTIPVIQFLKEPEVLDSRC